MYPPLEFISKFPSPGNMFQDTITGISAYPGFSELVDMTEEEYVSFLSRGNFTNQAMTTKEELLRRWIVMHADELLALSGFKPGDFTSGIYNVQTELRDTLLTTVLVDMWGRNKQVYKPDPDFAEALVQTDYILITVDMIEHLPSKSFYIDFSDCPTFNPATGAFLFIIPVTDGKTSGYSICEYLLTSKTLSIFSYYWGGAPNEKGELNIDIAQTVDAPFEFAPSNAKMGLHEDEPSTYTRKKISMFAMQLISYLYVKEPDLAESPTTKATYRKPTPGSKPKNRFSEIQQWDVGIRYGLSFREKKKTDAVHYQITEEGRRKSPNPHFRCAHWQRYWTGKGRTTCEVRWIEPIFVSGTGTAKDVVIHKIK